MNTRITILLALSLLMASCTAPVSTNTIATPTIVPTSKPKDTATIPILLNEPITIANQDFSLEINKITAIEKKVFSDRTSSLKPAARETHNFYEMQMRFTNHRSKPAALSYKNIRLSLPGVANPGANLAFVGYCLQDKEEPSGEPERCAYVPPSAKPGTYGITGVILLDTYAPEPEAASEIYFYFIAEKSVEQFTVTLIEPAPAATNTP